MPTLRIKLPNQGEATHVLTGDRVTIGRRPDNTIQIVDRSVSAHHAELIFVDGHYRLHDLGSTNLTMVEGDPVTDFHLHNSCTVHIGNVECDFDATPNPEEPSLPRLTADQMEKDMAFLRAENQELLNKIDGLQRRIDILSSARLITGKQDAGGLSSPDHVKRLTAEREELRFQTSGLKFELEKVREELSATVRERDAARQANELLQAEKASLVTGQEKGATQRLHFPGTSEADPAADLDVESSDQTTKLSRAAVEAASH